MTKHYSKIIIPEDINKKRVSQKSTTSPQRAVGVLLLRKEEKIKVLIIKCFPSFPRRGVMPEGS
jgi:hypothetical protein